MTPFIPPGATLGVVGGGQLGRMFVHAAQRMGYATAVLDPDAASPAGRVAESQVRTGYDDEAGLDALAGRCAAVTTEFENVPATALEYLAGRLPVAPAASSVAVCQDRALEKAHFERCGVPCVPHAPIESQAQLDAVDARALLPGILKTARLGYDGKGQVTVADRAALDAAWQGTLGGAPCVLERRLELAFELSVIVARGGDGRMVHLPVQQNLHRDGILAVTQVPAPDVSPALAAQAVAAAHSIAESLGHVGVLCVEFFAVRAEAGDTAADGGIRLLVNEMAPRPHNSGHHSLDACDLSQFDLQVRALAGAPLVAPRLHSAAVMLNLLGELWPAGDGAQPDWARLLALPGTHLHLYGKAGPRPGRKMGHLTVTAATPEAARATALRAAGLLGIAPF